MNIKKMFLPAVLVLSVLSLAATPVMASHCNKGSKTCPISSGHGSDGCEKTGKPCQMSGDCGKSSGCPIAAKFCKKACWLSMHKDALGLTEDQIAKLESLKLDMMKNSIRSQAETKIGMMELDKKLSENPLDVEEIESMIDSGMAGMATSAKASVKAYAELKSILTEDQIVKAKELKSARKAGHSHSS